MKLRLQANSVRLRLKQGEVARLMETGVLEESIRFLPGGDVLSYRLQLDEEAQSPSARLKGVTVIVEIPGALARRWSADATRIGIEAMQPPGVAADQALTILVEKDFACLDGDEAQNVDAFPNPLAGAKC